MKPFLLINPEHPGSYYAFFYLIAFLTGFVLLLIQGRKRNFPVIPWMLVIATAFLFFMIGCQLITFSLLEWEHVMRFDPIPYSTGRSVLGGILLSIPGILLARKFLRFKVGTMDAFAQVLPIALVVERFGCLMAGCCYGTPSRLPWAIQYGKASHAFAQQVHDGVLSADAPYTLPVHPAQLYEVLCCVVIVFVLAKLRTLVRAPGNLLLISIALYGVVRFLLEFIRASGDLAVQEKSALGMNCVQWVILLIVPALFVVIMRREKYGNVHPAPFQAPRNEFFRPAFYFLVIGSLFLSVSRWLGWLEIISFNIILIPLLATLTWYLFTWHTVPRFRVATLMLPVVALLLMNQTLPEYSKNDSTRLSYNTISLGWISGTSSMADRANQDCSGSSYSDTKYSNYDNVYSAKAFGIARTVQRNRENSVSFGVNAFTGTHHEIFQIRTRFRRDSLSGDQGISYYGVKPYVQLDRKKFGFGVGLQFGQFGNIAYPAGTYQSAERSSVRQFRFYPSASIRVGNLNKFFVEYRLANQFPSSFPALNHQLVLGFGLHKENGSAIRIGTASNAGFFVAPSIPMGGHILLEPYIGGGPGLSILYYQRLNNFIGSVSLHYKFNKKERRLLTNRIK